ncbi:zinc dependent phospholipase C family protein [Desnuesiella massiliensis]|uniref:zinc dependent phospholipase C family protein n=1 Tax=Desnuesiella massiliensis TaxID=1650662 RepID=UPI0006E19142|nr:zinc dependent phospholipase C family protein [Desnuesiella massiliensis]
MGSRIIHFCISDKLSRIIKVDRDRFLIGYLVADIPQLFNKPKDETHFMKKTENELKHDYKAFYIKYKDKLNDSFFAGYFCHLISDELWYDKIFTKYFGTVYPGKEYLKGYYYDFYKLNGRLIEYYNLENNINMIDNIEIDELDINMIPTFVQAVHKDFKYSKELLLEPLEVLNFEEVIEYINEAVEMSLYELAQRAILIR